MLEIQRSYLRAVCSLSRRYYIDLCPGTIWKSLGARCPRNAGEPLHCLNWRPLTARAAMELLSVNYGGDTEYNALGVTRAPTSKGTM